MLFTDKYKDLLSEMHAGSKRFGSGSKKHREKVSRFGFEDILDYGCGKGNLGLGRKYDPAIPEFSADPEPADLVVCTDVLEHIEPECLDDVLGHIRSKTKKKAYFVIATRRAKKTLPDGRNAHLIVESSDWWLNKLKQHYIIGKYKATDMELEVIGTV